MTRLLEIMGIFLLFFFQFAGLWFFIFLLIDDIMHRFRKRSRWLPTMVFLGLVVITGFSLYQAVLFD